MTSNGLNLLLFAIQSFSVSCVIIMSRTLIQLDSINISSLFLINFQRFIGGRTQSEIDSLVSSKTGGCTPLLIACRNGHYDVVQYLLKRCHADVEQCGSVIFDGETIENGKFWIELLIGSLWHQRLCHNHKPGPVQQHFRLLLGLIDNMTRPVNTLHDWLPKVRSSLGSMSPSRPPLTCFN